MVMMRPNAMRPFRLILRALQQPSGSRPPLLYQQRGFHFSRKYRYADDKPQPFKNQLYESTQQRLKRERAEQERYAQYQTQSLGGRYAALMFGIALPSSSARLLHYLLFVLTAFA